MLPGRLRTAVDDPPLVIEEAAADFGRNGAYCEQSHGCRDECQLGLFSRTHLDPLLFSPRLEEGMTSLCPGDEAESLLDGWAHRRNQLVAPIDQDGFVAQAPTLLLVSMSCSGLCD